MAQPVRPCATHKEHLSSFPSPMSENLQISAIPVPGDLVWYSWFLPALTHKCTYKFTHMHTHKKEKTSAKVLSTLFVCLEVESVTLWAVGRFQIPVI